MIKEFDNFQKNLNGKKFLVIYRDRNTNILDYIEIKIEGSNYYHLTGLAYKEDNGNKEDRVPYASRFYSELVDKKLSAKSLKFKDNNSQLKLWVLPSIMKYFQYSKMIGNFNESGIELKLDKVIGSTSVCLGLKKISRKMYAPASSLYGDTRKKAKQIHQVIAIFEKESEEKYEKIKYVAKGQNLHSQKYSDELSKLFSLKLYNIDK